MDNSYGNNGNNSISEMGQLKCWSSLILPAIILAIGLYIVRPILAEKKLWWVIRYGILAIIVLSGLSLAGQATLCLQDETLKSWGLGASTTGLVMVLALVLFVALFGNAVLLGMR